MDYENLILQQLEGMDLDSLYEMAGLVRDSTGVSFLTGLKEFVFGIVTGSVSLESGPLLREAMQLFFRQVQDSLSTCAAVVAVCILSGVMNSVADSFGKQTVSRVAGTICLLVVATICTRDFIASYRYCRDQMDLMIVAVQSLFPVILPLLLAYGKAVAGTILNPAVLGVIAMIATVMDSWILPAVFFSCALCIIGRMADQSFLNRAGKLMKDVIVFSVGLTVTVLSAFTTLQGTVGKTADSLIMKTARFSVDNFIPLIGGFAADSMDMVVSCTAAIKNAIGLWGVLLLLVLLLFPLIKLAAVIFVYRAASVLIEALTEKVIASCLDDIASAVTTLAVLYTLMGILFIVFVSVLVALS